MKYAKLNSVSSFAAGCLLGDGLVAGNEHLHDEPSGEVGEGAVAEDHHVAGGLAGAGFGHDGLVLVEGELVEEAELVAFLLCVGEEQAAAPIDGEGAETAEHGADAGDGGDG